MRALVITAGVVVALGLIGGGIFLWYQGRSTEGLAIEFITPDQVMVGEPFTLEVNVDNSSDHTLEDAELTIELPKDIAFLGSAEGKNIMVQTLGNVGVGSLTRERFELIALGGVDTVAPLRASVTYRTASLQTQFKKQDTTDIVIKGSALSFDITLPENIFGGEEFVSLVSYKNTGSADMRNLELHIDFPKQYVFSSATVSPDADDATLWKLGDLRSGSDGKIEITGVIVGPDGAFFDFLLTLTAEFEGRRYTIAEQTGSVAIQASPLSISIEGVPTVTYPGDLLRYTLRFVNNADIGFKDIVASARLIGEMFDVSSISSTASLRASDNTLIWNASNSSGLALLNPGESRTVSFDIRVKSGYTIKKLSDKDFVVRVDAGVESPTTPYFVAAQKTLSVTSRETKIGGKTELTAKGLFRDAQSGILNKGPWPMKVGQKTQFTIHWTIANYATDVSDVSVRAFLGGNVALVGEPKSAAGSILTYNKNTQEVVWEIPSIVATKGVIGTPVEAIFQVEASPSVTDFGNEMTLVGKSDLRAIDVFTGESLFSTANPVSSNALQDPTVKFGEGIVQ